MLHQLASVGELASGIAPEVKNPLAGMASGMNLLATRLGDDPAVRDILRQIRTQHTRIEGAIRDLLSYAPAPRSRTWCRSTRSSSCSA